MYPLTVSWNLCLYDSYMSSNISFSRCIGFVTEVLNGLVNVVSNVELASLVSTDSSLISVRPWYSSVFNLKNMSNDLSFLSCTLGDSSSYTSSSSVSMSYFSKSLSSEVTNSAYPTYWCDEVLLNFSMLPLCAFVEKRTKSILHLGFYNTNFWSSFSNFNIQSLDSKDLLLCYNMFLGLRSLSNVYGNTIRFLLKTWLRWSDDTLLSSLWYSHQVYDHGIASILNVPLRLTGTIDYISKMSVSSAKVCYGSVVCISSNLVDISGLTYEVNASSATVLLFASAYWSYMSNQYLL